jgi:hypothetical protein
MADIVKHLQTCKISPVQIDLARHRWAKFRIEHGWKPGAPSLLSPPENNLKTAKAGKKGIAITMGLSLAQAELSGDQACRYSTESCRDACVGLNGNRNFPRILEAAATKNKFLMEDPSSFISLMIYDIEKAYAKYGNDLQIRLNTFSDIPWEDVVPYLFSDRPYVTFYDYTKWPARNPPGNYHLTFSASERTSDEEIISRVKSGQNVAVVFSTSRTKDLPTTWNGLTVIDGDVHDARALDPKGVIVGLRAKGKMLKLGGDMVRIPA